MDYYNKKEYLSELERRFNEGGIIWLLERTDTNQFYLSDLSPHVHTFGKGYGARHCNWSNQIDLMVVLSGFLSKEDADKYGWCLDGFERGCSNCGHGGIPVKIADHEFVPGAVGQTEKIENQP